MFAFHYKPSKQDKMKLLWNVLWSHWNDYDTSKAYTGIFFAGQIYSSVIYLYIYIYNCIYIHLLKKKRLENWSSTPLDWEIHKFKNKLLICLFRALWSVIIRWSVGLGHCVWAWTSQIPSPLVHVHGRLWSHPELSL